MQAGCGLKVRKIRGRWYVYAWQYENGGARSRKVERYVGAAKSLETQQRSLRLLMEGEERARAALERRIERYRSALARLAP